MLSPVSASTTEVGAAETGSINSSPRTLAKGLYATTATASPLSTFCVAAHTLTFRRAHCASPEEDEEEEDTKASGLSCPVSTSSAAATMSAALSTPAAMRCA